MRRANDTCAAVKYLFIKNMWARKNVYPIKQLDQMFETIAVTKKNDGWYVEWQTSSGDYVGDLLPFSSLNIYGRHDREVEGNIINVAQNNDVVNDFLDQWLGRPAINPQPSKNVNVRWFDAVLVAGWSFVFALATNSPASLAWSVLLFLPLSGYFYISVWVFLLLLLVALTTSPITVSFPMLCFVFLYLSDPRPSYRRTFGVVTFLVFLIVYFSDQLDSLGTPGILDLSLLIAGLFVTMFCWLRSSNNSPAPIAFASLGVGFALSGETLMSAVSLCTGMILACNGAIDRLIDLRR